MTTVDRNRVPKILSADSFLSVLRNPVGVFLLRSYLEKVDKVHLLEFWITCERFGHTSVFDRADKANAGRIYSDFVHEGGPSSVPLTKNIRADVIRHLANPKKNMFDAAQKHTFDVIYDNHYRKFVMSLLSTQAKSKLEGPANKITAENLEGLGDCFCLTSLALPDHPIVFASDGFVRVTGYPRNQIIPFNCRFLQGQDTDRFVVKRLGTAVANNIEITELILNYRRDGTPFWNLLHMVPLKDRNGVVRFILGGQVDITKNFNMNSPLSELLNRCYDSIRVGPPPETRESGNSARRLIRALTKALQRKTTMDQMYTEAMTTGTDPKLPAPKTTSQVIGAEAEILNTELSMDDQAAVFYKTYSSFVVVNTEAKGKELKNKIEFVSDQFLKRSGFRRKEVIGKSLKLFFGPETNSHVVSHIKVVLKGSSAFSTDVACYSKSKELRRTRLHMTPLKDVNDKVGYFVILIVWP